MEKTYYWESNDDKYYWKPEKPVLVYDNPLAPTRGDTPVKILDNLIKDNENRPDAYKAVGSFIYDKVVNYNILPYLDDVIVGLKVGDHTETIHAKYYEDTYYVAETDWWEGEEKVWVRYIMTMDYVDDIMEGLKSNE